MTDTEGNVRRTIYLSRKADRVVCERAQRYNMGFSDVINEAILGPPTSEPGECWRMPEAPLGSVYLPSKIAPSPPSVYD
mgnify:CR=1 FL=1